MAKSHTNVKKLMLKDKAFKMKRALGSYQRRSVASTLDGYGHTVPNAPRELRASERVNNPPTAKPRLKSFGARWYR